VGATFFNVLMRLLKTMRIEFWFSLLLGFFAVVINQHYYSDGLTLTKAATWMIQYFSFGNPFFVWFFFFIYLLFLWQFYVALVKLVSQYIYEKKKPTTDQLARLLGYVIKPFILLAPLVIVTGPFFTLLGNMSYQLRLHTIDSYLLQSDFWLWRVSPFLVLPQLISSDVGATILKDAYMSLALLMSATLGALYVAGKQFLFRQAVLAFLLSLALSFPLFYAFPCQDPSHYVLQNLRANPLPAQVAPWLNSYKPSPFAVGVINSIDKAETQTTQDNAVPISCLPSMHAVWTVFIIYFLARLTLWSLAFTLPWAVLVLTGGLYVAQHYAIDYVAALPVAALSVWGGSLLLLLEKKMLKKVWVPRKLKNLLQKVS